MLLPFLVLSYEIAIIGLRFFVSVAIKSSLGPLRLLFWLIRASDQT